MDSTITETTETQSDLLKQRIIYDELVFETNEKYEQVIDKLLEDSKNIALSLRYPYQDYSNKELPNKYKNWQLRCSEELYQGIGTIGIKSYSENGLSWTKDSAYITKELMNEIEPVIGYIVKEEENDSTSS